uniref:Uncharacterized protein n=1 Tax=Anopheles farauti TaxID=69004 RepID=A0A182QCL1_9DIPT
MSGFLRGHAVAIHEDIMLKFWIRNVQSRNSGHQVSDRIVFEKSAHIPITNRMLNTAEPTIVPMPTSLNDTNTPMMLVNSSGALPPAAMNVAPATSSVMPSFSIITSSEGTKNSSHTIASATNIYCIIRNFQEAKKNNPSVDLVLANQHPASLKTTKH